MAPKRKPYDETKEYEQYIPPELKDWTKSEKYDLNCALKQYGFDIPMIHKTIPTKTEEQIQAAIDYFTSELNKKSQEQPIRRHKKRLKMLKQVPLAKWAEQLTDTYDYNDLQTDTASAVRTIADFEKFPHPSATGDIDFRKIYHYIADAMEGKPIPDDPIAFSVLDHCITETSDLSKSAIPSNELCELLGQVCKGEASVNTPRQSAESDAEKAALYNMLYPQNYNPLKIPEQYLKYPSHYSNDKSNGN